MPKSKRNKQVELAKTKKRGLDWKKGLFAEVQKCVDSYSNVFVFSVNDMRNSKMKNVRDQWKDSRFFIGKNKIMAMALGRSVEEEYKPNLHKIGQEIRGQRGLLFSNKSTEEVLSWFRSYSVGDYARSGNESTEDVRLSAGPLPMFPHSLEPYLRQLGLPTSLVKGEIHLFKDHEVCKAGDKLTPESAKILKLLGYEMAEFHITIDCMWSHDGSFLKFTDSVNTESKENIKKEKKKSIDKKPIEVEYSGDEMEILVDSKESKKGSPDKSLIQSPNNDSEENNTKEKESIFSDIKSDKDDDEDEMIIDLSDSEKDKDYFTDKNGTNGPLTAVSNDSITSSSTPKTKGEIFENKVHENENIIFNEENEISDKLNEDKSSPQMLNEDKSSPQMLNEDKSSPQILKEDKSSPEKVKENKSSRPVLKNTHKSNVLKRESLPKTPDANTSQDSPVFRQLRNRSVKVSRKKRNK